MTDNTFSFSELLKQYQAGIDTPSGTEWLVARSAIEAAKADLTAEEAKLLEKADRTLAAKARNMATILVNDEFTQARQGKPLTEWWWYPETVGSAASRIAPKPPSSAEQIFNNVINIVLIAAVGVILFLIARDRGLIPTPVAPTSTPFPTAIPTVVPTTDAALLDFSKATKTLTADKIVEISLPAGWKELADRSRTGNYVFIAGSDVAPLAIVSVAIDDPAAVYNNVFGITENITNPADVLTAFSLQLAAQAAQGQVGATASEVKPSKLGKFDGAELEVSVPSREGAGFTQYLIRAASIDAGKVAIVLAQSNSDTFLAFKPALVQMLDTISLNAGAIPTPTPTATLHPLQMTATYVQTLIIGLTPTATLTPVSTQDATAQPNMSALPTGEATSAATAAATTAATVAPTTAPSSTPVPPTATTTATATATTAATEAATPAK